ncbi:MAG: metallophosphoesterase family protein [Planctomycetota bacterium]|jgi:putative phosphoesterase
MIAIISDIHGNLEALKAVLSQLREAETVYCAGDVVGYGPNPNECCELLRSRGVLSVQGNHDFVCANMDRMGSDDEEGFPEEDRALCRQIFEQKNSAAKAASRWTDSVLTDENKEFLRSLPYEINAQDMTIVHGKPGSKADKLNEYMLPGHVHEPVADLIEGDLLIVGHSHIPMRSLRLVNPGSVGQPRDRDWHASYATLTDAWYRFSYIKEEDMSFRIVNQIVRIHRIPYDVRKTVQKIKAQPELPNALGDRLTVGL